MLNAPLLSLERTLRLPKSELLPIADSEHERLIMRSNLLSIDASIPDIAPIQALAKRRGVSPKDVTQLELLNSERVHANLSMWSRHVLYEDSAEIIAGVGRNTKQG